MSTTRFLCNLCRRTNVRRITAERNMSSNQITKGAIRSAFSQLLTEHSFSQISVKDIAGTCGISRNTFYYHFRDKYELLFWIVRGDLDANVESYEDPTRLAETFISVCRMMLERKAFYYPCLQYEGQDSLYDFFTEFYYNLWKENIAAALSTELAGLGEYEISVYARMNAHALVGVMRDWVHRGMQNNYSAYLDQVNRIISVQSELCRIMMEPRPDKGSILSNIASAKL